MIASKKVYQTKQQGYISVPIDPSDPEDLRRLHLLRGGHQRCEITEDAEGGCLQLRLYPGLATELLW